MNVMIIGNDYNKEISLIHQHLGYYNSSFFHSKLKDDIEKEQTNFKIIFTTNPKQLIGLRLKIPYIYNIPCELFEYENIYEYFHNFYSNIKGASAVFISDKKMGKYAEWLGLNPYWIPRGVYLKECKSIPKKFLTPKIDIGILAKNEEQLDILFKLTQFQKSNWTFHTINIELKDVTLHDTFEDMLQNIQVFIDLGNNFKHAFDFPSENAQKAMAFGCTLLAYNNTGNNSHIFFDKVHYFKIDFLNVNEIINTILYADKRREKLERMSKEGHLLIKKYFNLEKNIKNKIEIIKQYL